MKTQDIIFGDKKATGYAIELPGAPLVVAQAAKGFVMCGYLDLAAANRLKAAAAIVRGVNSVDDLLSKAVSDVSEAAQALGVKSGMTGLEALVKFL